MRLNDPVQYVKGIGPIRAQALEEFDIRTVEDIIYYFPRRYLDRRTIRAINQLKIGDEATVIGSVTGMGVKRTRRGQYFQVSLEDGSSILTLVWFRGFDWLKDRFQVGDRLAVHGKLEFYRYPQMVHPDFDFLDQDEDPLNTGKIVPLYPGHGKLKAVGLESRQFRRVMHGLWGRLEAVPDYYSPEFLNAKGLMSRLDALRVIHLPADNDELNTATHRLKFDEHFFLQLLMALRRKSVKEKDGYVFPDHGELLKKIYHDLPFNLTDAQVNVMREIRSDFQSGTAMNRLLQGDVGTGKTVLALLTAAIVVAYGAQVAVMAPTEILAEQHYRTFTAMSEQVHLPVALLTGSTSKADRKRILAGLVDGSIPLVVGTHALIQKDVHFKRLALQIIDEQHRFGVMQRGTLLEKGAMPHVLAMTATPIPRTLAITLHGDMDISVLDQVPADRAGVTTRIVSSEQLGQVYKQMHHEIAAGHQCFVVYPIISESEKGDLQAAEKGYKALQNKVFPDAEVGYLHGRLKSKEKDRVMSAFKAGDVQVLVSTTVIEVGIDVPNATIMVIENAERFGLTQLHQLRGRIGRGRVRGHCYLVQRGGAEESTERLQVLVRTSNGFEIAEEDLKLRGPGEMFGANQHGFEKFQLANLITDGPIIRVAREAAFEIVRQDQYFQKREHRLLQGVLKKKYKDQLDFIKLS